MPAAFLTACLALPLPEGVLGAKSVQGLGAWEVDRSFSYCACQIRFCLRFPPTRGYCLPMSEHCDAEIRLKQAQGRKLSPPERARFLRLDAARRARVGDWSEEELEAAICGLPLDRAPSSVDLKRACLGAGDLDRSLSLDEASLLLGVEGLHQAAACGELATLPGGKMTSEARIGAWIVSQEIIPKGDQAAALRMVYLCGVACGQRRAG